MSNKKSESSVRCFYERNHPRVLPYRKTAGGSSAILVCYSLSFAVTACEDAAVSLRSDSDSALIPPFGGKNNRTAHAQSIRLLLLLPSSAFLCFSVCCIV